MLQQAGSSTSSLDGSASGSLSVPCSSLCCVGGGWGWLGLRRHGAGAGSGAGGRQRFFQLSTDGACLRWSWHRWVLMPHVEAIHFRWGDALVGRFRWAGTRVSSCACLSAASARCPSPSLIASCSAALSRCAAAPARLPTRSDGDLTIRLRLLLEPDLNLRFASRQQYEEWCLGLRLLLELLQQPDELLQPSCRSSPTAAAAAAGAGLLGRRSGGSRPSSSGAGSGSGVGRFSTSLSLEAILGVPAKSGGSAAAAAGDAVPHLPAPRLPSINTGRVCARADSAQQLQLASARSRAALLAAVQRQQEGQAAAPGGGSKPQDGEAEQQQQQPGGGVAAHLRRNTIHLVASSHSMRDLHIRTSSSEALGEQPARQRSATSQRQASPRGGGGGATGRLRSSLRRAATLPASLLERVAGGAVAAAGTAAVAAPATAVQVAEAPAQVAETRHQRTFTLMEWAEEQPGDAAAAAAADHAGQPAADGSPQLAAALPPPSQPRQRTPLSAGGRGRMLLPGPFIHLVGAAGTSLVGWVEFGVGGISSRASAG